MSIIPENPEIPTIVYFAIRGRPEVSRMMFEVAGEKYQNIASDMSTWHVTKKELLDKKLSSQGQLPLYIDREVGIISQSKAINRYVARKLGFLGKNIIDEARIDEVVEAIDEVSVEIIGTFYDPETVKNLEQNKKNFRTKLQNLENFILRDGQEYLVGDSLTLADFHLCYALDIFKPYIPDILDECRRLEAFRRKFHQIPRFKEYCASDRRYKCFTADFAAFGGKPEETQQGDE